MSPNGPVLGEFSANPFNLAFHCLVPKRNGSSDPCHMGKVFQSTGGLSPGARLPAPSVLTEGRSRKNKKTRWMQLQQSKAERRALALRTGALRQVVR